MGEKRGTKALEVWCKRVTDGYPGVKVENMTTSWRDGLAFCAIIHHFRPDLIDFHSLDKRDVLHNNELAFSIAERHLGIPALLDAEDMVEYEVPDRLSMLTYLSQFYQTFAQRSPGNSPTSRTPIKRSSLSPEPASLSPASQSPPTKVSARGDSGDAHGRMLRRDPCNKCGQPVFLAERLMVSSARLLFHRTCFRCARCSSQLTLANYYETEDGRFCCETCPDEEKSYQDQEPAPAPANLPLAPLATGDPSSSEQSRPSSVIVDTNDLPSNEACDPVNNVDRVQSSETEDYAKDQSLSLVQLRRKLFENVSPKNRNSQVFDSGQVRVSNGIKQTKPVEEPKTDEDKLMKLKPSTDGEDVSEKDASMELDRLKDDESPVFNVKETVETVVKKDEPSIADVKDDEPLVPKAREDESPVPKAQEYKPSVPTAHENEPPAPKLEENEAPVSKAEEDKLPVPNVVKDESSVLKAEHDDPPVPKAKEDEPPVPKAEKDEPSVPKAEKDEPPVPKAEEDEPPVPKAEEDEPPVPNAREDEPPVLKSEEDEPPVLKAEKDVLSVSKAEEDAPLVPKAEEGAPPFPKAEEDEPPVPMSEEDETPALKASEDEVSVVKSKGNKLFETKEDKPVVPKCNENDALTFKAKEDEPISSKIKEDEPLVPNEGEPLVSKAKEDGPFTSGQTEDELTTKQRDASVVGVVMDLPTVETEPSEPYAPPAKKEVESKTEDDGILLKCEEESVNELSGKEVERASGEDEKNYSGNEIKNHVPPRPPLPAVKVTSATAPKPPVTPRKTSLAVSPKKTAPVVTPREKPTVQRVPSYPAELNPFGDDSEEGEDVSKEESTNPFNSEEEEVTLRRKEEPPSPSKPPQRPATHHGGSVSTGTGTVDTRRFIPAPAHLNPFWEDGEEPEDEEDDIKPAVQKPPVPKPRTVLTLASDSSASPNVSPFNNRSTLTRSSGRFGSANSLSSIVSSASTMRRKKHAAPPPPVSSANSTLSPRATSFSPGSATSVPSSPTLSSGRSTLGRSRKSRPAPQPPSLSPNNSNRTTWNPSTHYRPLAEDSSPLLTSTPNAKPGDEWQEGKLNKDELNRNRQNQLSAQVTGDISEDLADDSSSIHSGDKSSHGKWKRKKGPAPPRPIPQRRQIRAIPLKELKRELDDIEVLQLELERQGVNLERTIRRKFDENPDASESSMTPDIEDLVLQLFELVNEKNELFRKQAELMYLRRQQRLEEEHADLEYQIRILMEQPERNKTDSDKAKEEKLIQRLVEVVERRNEIVECLEMDRLREAEEDHSIHSRLELFASKSLALNDAYISDLYKSTPALTCCALKEKKRKKDKTKKGTLRLHKKEKQVDADKDIDETEVEQIAKEKKTKRKWF